MMEVMPDSAFRPYRPVATLPNAGNDYISNNYSDYDQSVMSSGGGKDKGRRKRTTFTPEQTTVLEREYALDRYMASGQRSQLADRLSLTENQVKTWFQNRRAKDKKDGRRSDDISATPSSECSAETSLPSHNKNDILGAKHDVIASPLPNSTTSSNSAITAALQSPNMSASGSSSASPFDPNGLPPTPPCRIEQPVVTTPAVPVAVPTIAAPQPIQPVAGNTTSYLSSDYLSSVGLNPMRAITSPTPYPSVYDPYGHQQPQQQYRLQQLPPHSDYRNTAFLAAMALDPAVFSLMNRGQQHVAVHGDITQL